MALSLQEERNENLWFGEKEMKIYLAGTMVRESVKVNEKRPEIENHLESYFYIINKKADIRTWSIFRRKKHESSKRRSSKDPRPREAGTS